MGTPDVFLRDRYDQAEIGFSQPLLGVEIAFLYRLGELHLVLAGQKGDTADFLQIHLYQIGRYFVLAHIHQTRLDLGRLLFTRTEFLPLLDRLDLQDFFRPNDPYTSVLQFLIQQFESFEILLDILNRKLAPKQVQLDRDAGYQVKTHDGQGLALSQLSSGEQHELVLLHSLLFRVERGALLLIDEPELSLHVTWQTEFLEDLIRIAKQVGFSAVLATHSPYIVGKREDLMVRLGAPA